MSQGKTTQVKYSLRSSGTSRDTNEHTMAEGMSTKATKSGKELVSKTATMAANTTVNDTNVSNAELKTIMLRMESSMNEQLNLISKRVDTLYELVDENDKKIADLADSQKEQQDQIKDLAESATVYSDEVSDLRNRTIPEVEKKLQTLKEQINNDIKMKEIRDRKYNLLFYGAESQPDENVYHVIRDSFMTDFHMTREESDSIFIQNAHRLPRRNAAQSQGPEPIIVKFASMSDRDYILEKQAKRGFDAGRRPVVAYTDLPSDMKRKRGMLAAEAKKLRASGRATRIRVIGTDVILEHRPKGQNGAWVKYRPTE